MPVSAILFSRRGDCARVPDEGPSAQRLSSDQRNDIEFCAKDRRLDGGTVCSRVAPREETPRAASTFEERLSAEARAGPAPFFYMLPRLLRWQALSHIRAHDKADSNR